MSETTQQYAIKRHTNKDFDAAVDAVTTALSAEGFGILTDIDVKATLKKKIGVDFLKMRILGACNPPMAFEALTVEPDISILLPCNVVVRELGDGGVEIAAMDPRAALPLFQGADLKQFASAVAERIERALDKVQ